MPRPFDNLAGSKWWRGNLFANAAAILCISASLFLAVQLRAENAPARASVDRSGELHVNDGMTLHVTADLGNVRIQTLPAGAPPVLRYTFHVETDVPGLAGQRLLDFYSLATRETMDSVFLSGTLPNMNRLVASHRTSNRNAQFFVQILVTVPASFNLDVSTGTGDIETADITGRAVLMTEGGNITAGHIGATNSPFFRSDRPMAKIESVQGGHITLKEVVGDVDAYTGGGHIVAGTINGNAKLRTGGGHIRAARIEGTARLETEGGNVTIGEAGSYVGVRTAGGQIDFGEVHGSVHAETGGGGIRVMYVSGPMEVTSTGGSICLTRVANRVQAATGEGTITAWINPETSEKNQLVRLSGPSQLSSRSGDILVFLPRNIAMTIDAIVENGSPSRIQADSSLPLNVQSTINGPVHAVVSLNGGGPTLKLHTTAGKIQLQYLDAQAAYRQFLENEIIQRLREKLNDPGLTQVSPPGLPAPPSNPPPALSPDDFKDGWLDAMTKRIEVIFMGSVHEDNKEFVKRLINAPRPEYPPWAVKAGVQGNVVLQVRLKADGSVTVEKVLEGEPALVEAAKEALRKWQAKPEQVAGKNVDVVSTVKFEFNFH